MIFMSAASLLVTPIVLLRPYRKELTMKRYRSTRNRYLCILVFSFILSVGVMFVAPFNTVSDIVWLFVFDAMGILSVAFSIAGLVWRGESKDSLFRGGRKPLFGADLFRRPAAAGLYRL